MRSLAPFLLLFVACAPAPPPEEDAGPAEDPNRASLDAAYEFLAPELRALAVPSEQGSLAGTFALRSVSATIVDTVIDGYQRGGGVNFRLVTRSYDDDEGVYRQESRLCGGYNFEVAGLSLTAGEEVYRAVAPSLDETVRVDHERGVLLDDGHVQLWALRDLPDARTTPLPATVEEASQPPHSERIYDMDDDGNPGVTLYLEGAATGEAYAIQRKLLALTGVVTEGGALGYVSTTYHSLILGGDNPLLAYADPSKAEAHPDPNESWFIALPLPEGSDCDDVMAVTFPETPPWLDDGGG